MSSSKLTYRKAIAQSMNDVLSGNQNAFIIGQGVTDHKGIFGTTTELLNKFPTRVIETPLAEDSIAGICIGAALHGSYPINIHIRADFAFLFFNQLINHAAKYRYMFGGLFEIPLLFRVIVGRSWGQGAQHSQSLHSILSNIPGLTVVAPSSPYTLVDSYKYSSRIFKNPVISFEHRLLYDVQYLESEEWKSSNPLKDSHLINEGEDVTIISNSIMTIEAKRVLPYLEKLGISVDLIDMHSISHPNFNKIFESLKKTHKLLILDNGWSNFGVSAEISRLILEKEPRMLEKPVITLSMKFAPCPTSKILEDSFYPNLRNIFDSVLKLLDITDVKENLFPSFGSTSDYIKNFKGPF